MGRHLFIVARDKRWLFDHLVERFAEDQDVIVLLDRRVGERRRKQEPHPTERRRGERRARRDSVEEDFSRQGYLMLDLS
jgi:hypothetical protein